MAGAVNVSIVTVLGLILNVSGIDGDATLSLLRSLIDVGVINEASASPFSLQNLGDRSGQSGLTMVNVADGANVTMGFVSFKFSFAILIYLLFYTISMA